MISGVERLLIGLLSPHVWKPHAQLTALPFQLGNGLLGGPLLLQAPLLFGFGFRQCLLRLHQHFQRVVQVQRHRQLFPFFLQLFQAAGEGSYFGFLFPQHFLSMRQAFLAFAQLAFPVGTARRSAHKAGRTLRTAVSMDHTAAESPVRQQRGSRLRIRPGDTAQTGQNGFPKTWVAIRDQTGNGIADGSLRNKKPVRICLEQLLNLTQMLRLDHQSIQNSGISQLRFQQIPHVLPQVRRKVHDLIKGRMRDAAHHQLKAGRLYLVPSVRYGFRLVSKPCQLQLNLISLLLPVLQFKICTVFRTLQLAKLVAVAGINQIPNLCPVGRGTVLGNQPLYGKSILLGKVKLLIAGLTA